MDAQNQSFEGYPFKVWRCQRLNASTTLLGIIFKLEKHNQNTIEQWSHEQERTKISKLIQCQSCNTFYPRGDEEPTLIFMSYTLLTNSKEELDNAKFQQNPGTTAKAIKSCKNTAQQQGDNDNHRTLTSN
jgi:Flp pilus assembly protein TadD